MKRLMVAALVSPLLLGVAACTHEGPAERAGKNLDQAGQSVSDALNPPKGPAQSVGRSIDRTLGQ